jgi:hypothetical protein
MPEILLVLAISIAYLLGQHLVRRWVAQRWVEDRISNVGAVLTLLATPGVGLGLLIMAGMLIMKPSGGALGGLLMMLFLAMVGFGFLMTVIDYAATHGVREHLRRMREQQERTRKQ